MSEISGMLKMGTRGSLLARTQSGRVAEQIANRTGVVSDTVIISTTGDRILDAPLAQIGGKGLFVREIEDALLAGSIDYAVHSLKDLPADQPTGLVVAAYPPREDPRDAFIPREDLVAAVAASVAAGGSPLDALPQGARVGTSSLRRVAFLKAARPDLDVVPLRGNVDTRLRKGREGQGGLSAVVLAAAGLARLGWLERDTMFLLPESLMLPAVGQGILAVECRASDVRTLGLLASIDDPPARARAAIERGFLGAVGGSCQIPLACHARSMEDAAYLLVEACVADPDGTRKVTEASAVDAHAQEAELAEVGAGLANRILDAGGREILEKCLAAAAPRTT